MSISFTAIRRVTECPPSEVMPHARSTSGASVKGTNNHEAVRLAIVTGNHENISPKLSAWLKECTDLECEVAYAVDTLNKRVRRIGVNIGRNYGPVAPHEIPGTTDLICRRGGRLWAIDFKSRTRVEDAATNPQIIAGAVCAMAEFGDEEASGGIWYLNDDYFDCEGAEFTALDVASYYAARVRMFGAVAIARDAFEKGEALSVHTGEWCQYCPAFHHCPAKTRLALAMIGELATIQNQIQAMTSEQAGRAWEKVAEIEKVLEPIAEALKQRAIADGSLPIEGGKRMLIYKEERMNGYDFDAIKAAFADMNRDVPRKAGVKLVPRKLKVA